MMTVSPGMTAEEIREVVHAYHVQPHGTKAAWLAERGFRESQIRRWRSAVFAGDVDRGLVPREGGLVTVPPQKRTRLEQQRARERAEHEAEVARLNAQVAELKATNEALGKAIGLLHARNEQEPVERPRPSGRSSS